MKRFQRTLTATVAAAALLGSLAFSVHAQTDAAPAAAPQTQQHHTARHQGHRAHKPVDFAQLQAARTERLKTLLQIQPSQQSALDQYVQAIKPQHRTDKAGAERPDFLKLTTPERLDLAQKLRKERTAKVEQREQATRTFYASLNASQQKAFDELHSRHGGPRKAGHAGPRNSHPRADHPGQRGHAPHHPHHGAPATAPAVSAS